MTVTRLRPLPDLDGVYGEPHDASGHADRIAATIAFARRHVPDGATVADLSCGTGEIARALCDEPILGDFTPGWPIQGRIEDTARELDPVDVWVMTETLEHVDDPLLVLNPTRSRASVLILSTPVGCFDDTNTEHVWAWDREGVEGLLDDAGWGVDEFLLLPGEPYSYGCWVCS